MAIGRVDYKKSTNLESVASAITSMGQRASKKDKPEILGQKIKAISTDATAIETKVLQGETFYAGGQKKVGSMVNQGAINTTLNAGGNYVIPQGYHNGSGKIVANSLASQTSATATASNILSGKTAYVNGNKITGTIQSKGAQTYTPKTTNQTIGAGQYLSGAQTILGDPNLISANIVKGKTIFGVKGSFVMPESPSYLIQSGVSISSLGSYRQVSNINYIAPSNSNVNFVTLNTIKVDYYNGTNGTFVALSNPIDVSLYKKLIIQNYTESGPYSVGCLVGIISETALLNATYSNINSGNVNISTGWTAVASGSTAKGAVISCDIENLSGKYYIALGIKSGSGNFRWYLQDMYLSV